MGGFGAVPWHDALSCGRSARIWNIHDTTYQESLPQGAQDTIPEWAALDLSAEFGKPYRREPERQLLLLYYSYF